MFCDYCGNKLPEGSKFCTNCGHSVETVSAVKSLETPSLKKNKSTQNKQKKKKGMVIALGTVLVVLVIVAIVLAVILFGMGEDKEYLNNGGRQEKVSKSVDEEKDDTEEAVVRDDSTESVEKVAVDSTEVDVFKKDRKDRKKADSDSDDLFQGNKSGFVFPNSDTQRLTEDEIEDMLDESDDPLWDIRIAINELYARHGRKFDTPEIKEYFERQDWYEGRIDGEEFDKKQNDYLNDAEIYNRDLLSQYRSELQ